MVPAMSRAAGTGRAKCLAGCGRVFLVKRCIHAPVDMVCWVKT